MHIFTEPSDDKNKKNKTQSRGLKSYPFAERLYRQRR